MTNHQYLIDLCKEYNLPLGFNLYVPRNGLYFEYEPKVALTLSRNVLNSTHSYWRVGKTSVPAPSIASHSFASLHSLVLSCALPS